MSAFQRVSLPVTVLTPQNPINILLDWYKRPTSQPMNTVDTNVDTVINDRMYPGIIRFGGNTGTVNSFVGVDTGDLTGGAFNGASLLEG